MPRGRPPVETPHKWPAWSLVSGGLDDRRRCVPVLVVLANRRPRSAASRVGGIVANRRARLPLEIGQAPYTRELVGHQPLGISVGAAKIEKAR